MVVIGRDKYKVTAVDMPLSVLFLCTGNSCRSIMAEALLAHYGGKRFLSYSAGSFPAGSVHPMSIATLKMHGIEGTGYRSKSWDEFINQSIDVVMTVCDAAAGESCPIFSGRPLKAHWGVPDPAKFEGTEEEIQSAFSRVYSVLEKRVKALVSLPLESLSRERLYQRLFEIGKL